MLASLPLDAELAVIEGNTQFAVKRVTSADGTSSFLVDHGGDLIDLADYASQFAGDEEQEESTDSGALGVTLVIVIGVIVAWKMLSARS